MTFAETEAAGAHPKPRKKRRIFLWFFLAVQVIFLILIITSAQGNASGQGARVDDQAVSFCGGNGWQGLYGSYADCVSSYGNDLNAASDTSTAIGLGFVIALWVAVDVITGVSYGVYRLTTRGNR